MSSLDMQWHRLTRVEYRQEVHVKLVSHYSDTAEYNENFVISSGIRTQVSTRSLYSLSYPISFPEPAILGKEREALG
jgi:hypothetical protein